jgi:hypothetical protein
MSGLQRADTANALHVDDFVSLDRGPSSNSWTRAGRRLRKLRLRAERSNEDKEDN